MRKSLVILAMLTLVAGFANGATLDVPGTYATIQAAITAAAGGDVVLVQDGTYASFDLQGKDIVVISANGPAACVVNVVVGGGVAADGSNDCGAVLFNCPATARVSGFTFQGPGTYADEYSRGVTVGGQAGPASSGEVDNCIITGFDAGGNWGGGVSLGNGTGAYIHDNLILANDAQHGGGMMQFDTGVGSVTESNEFAENLARGLGGPSILCYEWYGSEDALIANNLFHGNGSANTDQGLRVRSGAGWNGGMNISHNSFYGEIAIQDLTWGNGGFASCIGLGHAYNYGPEYMMITNNLMYNNGNTPVNAEDGVSPLTLFAASYFGGNVTETLAGCFRLAQPQLQVGPNLDITADPFTAAPGDMTQAAGAPSIDYAGTVTANSDCATLHGTGNYNFLGPITDDKDDVARDATPDAGAYEAAGPSSVADAQCPAYTYEGNNKVSGTGATLQVDGSASICTTYLWTQTGGIAVGVTGATTATVAFTAPAWDGSTELTVTQATLNFQLDVDGGADTDTCSCYVRIPGDANGDNTVNAFDVAAVRTLQPAADFNADGAINAFDVSILRVNALAGRGPRLP